MTELLSSIRATVRPAALFLFTASAVVGTVVSSDPVPAHPAAAPDAPTDAAAKPRSTDPRTGGITLESLD